MIHLRSYPANQSGFPQRKERENLAEALVVVTPPAIPAPRAAPAKGDELNVPVGAALASEQALLDINLGKAAALGHKGADDLFTVVAWVFGC